MSASTRLGPPTISSSPMRTPAASRRRSGSPRHRASGGHDLGVPWRFSYRMAHIRSWTRSRQSIAPATEPCPATCGSASDPDPYFVSHGRSSSYLSGLPCLVWNPRMTPPSTASQGLPGSTPAMTSESGECVSAIAAARFFGVSPAVVSPLLSWGQQAPGFMTLRCAHHALARSHMQCRSAQSFLEFQAEAHQRTAASCRRVV